MPSIIHKRFEAQLQVQPDERAVVAYISTAAVDRDGEVLLSLGCDATEFLKSPTVFFNHDYTKALGQCTAFNHHADRLEAKTVFATKPTNHQGAWLPDEVLALFQQGVLRGFSVGFVPVQGRRPTVPDRQKYGSQVRYVHTRWKLLEYSVAPLPANPQALALEVSPHATTPSTKALPATPRQRVVLLVPGERGITPEQAMSQTVQEALWRRRGLFYLPSEA